MKQNLKFYQIDMKYVRELAKASDNVMSISPQTNKNNRPFVGIIILINGMRYCVPLTSPKEKFKNKNNAIDFVRIRDNTKLDEHGQGKIIGALNFNNMLPVNETVVKLIDIKIRKYDDYATIEYKKLLTKQLDWCQKNEDSIISHANKTYTMVTRYPERNHNLTRRCCDFKKLEQVLERKMARKQFEEQDQSNNQTQTQPIIYPHKGGGRR